MSEHEGCLDDASCRPIGRFRYCATLLLVALVVVALWALLAVATWAVRGATVDNAPTPQGTVERSAPLDADGGWTWTRPAAQGARG